MQSGHTDVVSDFIYDAENRHYNHDYKAWRKSTASRCAYRYIDNAREKVFVSGKPAPRLSAAQTERQALSYAAEVIGAALLVLLVCDLGGSSLLIWILRRFGVDIQLDFLTLTMRGNQWMITAVRVLSELLKYGIPLIILIRGFKLPGKVIAPTGFGGLPALIAAAGCGAVCCGLCAVPANHAAVEMVQMIYTYKEPEAVLAYGLFDILVISVLSELLLRGTVLPVLRQFGDIFGIAVTAAIAFLFPAGVPDRIGELLIGLASGYLLLRSGSFWNCVLLRVTYAVLMYVRLWAVYANDSLSLLQYVLLLISAGAAALLLYGILRRGRLRLKNRRTALSLREKLFACTQTVTSLPWTAASALLTLLQIFY